MKQQQQQRAASESSRGVTAGACGSGSGPGQVSAQSSRSEQNGAGSVLVMGTEGPPGHGCHGGSGGRAELGATPRQDYEALRRATTERGDLFQDPLFDADMESLGSGRLPADLGKLKTVMWRRPLEISQNAVFMVDSLDCTDMKQGDFGDCWLLAAIASLTLHPRLLARVVPEGQSFSDGYAGIFHFQFWQFGEWVDVVVDDRLPTYNNKLVFVHSPKHNEFWAALLEKAYAKLHGSYEALRDVGAWEAMEDFTGGIMESLPLTDESPELLYRNMRTAFRRGSFLACSVDVEKPEPISGLEKEHVYFVTGIKEACVAKQKVPLMLLKDPWAQSRWKGPWGHRSQEWRQIAAPERKALLSLVSDEEFWMSLEDFRSTFTQMQLCHLTPADLGENTCKRGSLTVHRGCWVRGCSAGGGSAFPGTFWTNPQFNLQLFKEDDDPTDGEVDCSFIVSLIQTRSQRFSAHGCRTQLLPIGFSIFQEDKDAERRWERLPVAGTADFVEAREVFVRFCLPPGTYTVVPSTREPHHEAGFVLRILAEKLSSMSEDESTVAADLPLKMGLPSLELTEQEKAELFMVFSEVAGEEMEVRPNDLLKIFNSHLNASKALQTDSFSIETCRSMVALLDTHLSGRLGFEELQVLWAKIKTWKDIFRRFDQDGSGMMSSYELHTALNSAGFPLNNRLRKVLVLRYADQSMQLCWDKFVCCLLKIEATCKAFQFLQTAQAGVATMTIAQWLICTMYT
ncbi:calpain-9-like isoform X2 [Lethenteron reissneri]|uniref:calpain-9-like isoform X2 n=1 Tax=Lethenteron reissneri TaxID=7753 RepID=UPI002AB7B63D|nr:calpain-9-like isoform X2 [Lethenteron reissneri]XP_061415353.1 calpain-9-like isoform X2 [Lethenteron reissneri]XP_061415354.1 calpain-9-like isoform X2 [Lethenteron reissneri]